jgi:hypothetical protein
MPLPDNISHLLGVDFSGNVVSLDASLFSTTTTYQTNVNVPNSRIPASPEEVAKQASNQAIIKEITNNIENGFVSESDGYYIPLTKYDKTNFVNSSIYQSGLKIGINTTSPQYLLDVAGGSINISATQANPSYGYKIDGYNIAYKDTINSLIFLGNDIDLKKVSINSLLLRGLVGTTGEDRYLTIDDNGDVSATSDVNANRIRVKVRNSTGSTIYKGMIVYMNGSTGNRPTVALSRANSEATSARTFGAAFANIPNNTDGYVVVMGNIDTLDTRSNATHPFTTDTLADGDTLYLSPTNAGYVTNVKPSAPNHMVYIGKVVRTTPTNGTIEYQIQNGYELDELHDVAISSLVNGDILYRDTTTNLWKNGALLATAPLSYNASTRTFSISQANATTNGYLSSTDWNTFNNKQGALNGTGFVKVSGTTITYDNSVYYLASNPSNYIPLTALSAIAPLSYNNSTGVFSITQANATTNGYLSSADWVTFNSKSSGSGTTNYLAKWTSANVLGDSVIREVNGNIGIGAAPLANINIRLTKNVTGGTLGYGALFQGTAQSDVTGNLFGVMSTFGTQASTFTLGNLYNFYATQGAFGAGSVVTGQFGFHVDSSLVGATNNYGFFGNIPSGTGRWNIYMNGTAVNYLAGNLGIGTTITTYKLNWASGANLGFLNTLTGGANIGSTGIFEIWTGSTPSSKVRVNSSGNVSINNTNDTYKLDVTGTGYFSSTLTANSFVKIGGLVTQYLMADGSISLLTDVLVTSKLLTNYTTLAGTVSATDTILQAFGKVQAQLNALSGSLIYKGSWNAATNTPTIVSSVGVNGNYYIVSTAGTTNINGISSWAVGDWIVFNSATNTWQKISNQSVTSVNGFTGVVTITTSNIAEGTNLYYTQTRFDTAFSLKSTTNLAEGTNLYYTQTRFDTAFSLKSTTNLVEGTNLYYTDSRARLALSSSSPELTYNNASGAFSITSGYVIPTTSEQTNWTLAYTNRISSLTTIGSSGAATLLSNVLNIPNYTLAGLGGQAQLNGTGFVKISGTTISYDNSVYYLASNPSNYIPLTALSAIAPLSYNNSTGVFSISQANATTNGYLSSADWVTFNSKQGALNGTGFVKISGTTISYDNSVYYLASNPNNYIPLTALSAIAPLSYNNSTGVFSITQANATTNGYLSSADWVTFNSKQGALTLGNLTESTSGVLTIVGGSNAIIGSGVSIQVKQASSSVNGYLSSIDWTIFSNKVPSDRTITINGVTYDLSANRSWTISSGGTSGNGTVNYLPKWISSTVLGDSAISETASTATISLPYLSLVYNNLPYVSLDIKNLNSAGSSSIRLINSGSSTRVLEVGWGGSTNAYANKLFVYDYTADQYPLVLNTSSAVFSGMLTGTGFKTPTGTALGFLKANGTVDTSTYVSLSSFSAIEPLYYNNSTGTFNIVQSSGVSGGYLSSTDWTRFNNKVSTDRTITINGVTYDLSANRSWTISSGGITGNGTVKFIPLWLTSSTLGDSTIFQNAAGGIRMGYTLADTDFTIATLKVKGKLIIEEGDLFIESVNAQIGFSISCNSAANATGRNVFISSGSNSLVYSGSPNDASYNIGLGYDSLFSLTKGYDNISIGNNSLKANTLGYKNIAIGSNALSYNTTSHSNIAIGDLALNLNDSGLFNIAIGRNSLSLNSSGYQNIGVGYNSLNKNTTGARNVAIGHSALELNIDGVGNVAVGGSALSENLASSNSAFGDNSLRKNTSGTLNSAFGLDSLYWNTSGSSNSAFGVESLWRNSIGVNNVGVGLRAIAENTLGSNNTAIGYWAGYDNFSSGSTALKTGNNNIFIGYKSTGENGGDSNRTWIGNSDTASTWLGGNVLIGTKVNSTYKLDVNGTTRISSSIKANSFIKEGGTSSQYLMADGSVSTGGGGSGITGSGTNGYLAKWTSATNISTGLMYDIGTSAGYGVLPSTFYRFNIETSANRYIGFWIPTLEEAANNGIISHNGSGLTGLTPMGYNASSHYFNSIIFVNSSVNASAFIKTGGTSAQYLMADGSVSTGGGGGSGLSGGGTIFTMTMWGGAAYLIDSQMRTSSSGNLYINGYSTAKLALETFSSTSDQRTLLGQIGGITAYATTRFVDNSTNYNGIGQGFAIESGKARGVIYGASPNNSTQSFIHFVASNGDGTNNPWKNSMIVKSYAINLPNIPTSTSGLVSGDVYKDSSGFLKIV